MYERHAIVGGVYVCARCGAEVGHAWLDGEDEGAPILCDADYAREVGLRENTMRYSMRDSYLTHPELNESERAAHLAHNIWDVVDTYTGAVIYTAEERDADLYARLRNRGLDPGSTAPADWEAAWEAERTRRTEEAG